jgi:uncharacterized protein YecT (DUF1311 family)
MKTWLPILLAVLVSAVLANGQEANAGKAGSPTLPKNWNLLLDPDDLDSLLKPGLEDGSGNIPQQMMNQYLATMASVWDAKLLVVYVTLSDRLSAADKSKLRQEQAAWVAAREKQAKAAGEGEEGGSAAPAEYSDTFIKLTQERIAKLQAKLKALGK